MKTFPVEGLTMKTFPVESENFTLDKTLEGASL